MKKYGIQLIAVTAVAAALAGCGRDRSHHGAERGPYIGMCGHDKVCSEEDITDFVNDARVSPEKKLQAIAFQLDQITTETVHGCLEGRTAPHTLNRKLFFTADFFYWKPYEDGLAYAIEETTNTVTLLTQMHVKEPHMKWEPGFRVGAGFNFGMYDYWDLNLNYTYYYGKGGGQICECGEVATVAPQWYPALLGGVASFAKVKWCLNYDVLDLELGRHYFVSEALSVRPHLGLRGAIIRQKYDANYAGEFSYTNSTPTPSTISTGTTPTSFDAKNNFGGGGIRTGAGLLWHLSPHWGINGQISGSLLYGNFDIDETVYGGAMTTDAFGTPLLQNPKYKIRDNYHRIRTNLEAALGLQWEKHFVCTGNNLSFGVFYELSQWYRQNELLQFTQTTDSSYLTTLTKSLRNDNTSITADERDGDLGFQGVSFRFRFDF